MKAAQIITDSEFLDLTYKSIPIVAECIYHPQDYGGEIDEIIPEWVEVISVSMKCISCGKLANCLDEFLDDSDIDKIASIAFQAHKQRSLEL